MIGEIEQVEQDRRAPLDAFFRPRRIAIIGATEKPGSVGRTLLSNLTSGSFKGKVFAVNPKHSVVAGCSVLSERRTSPGAYRLGRHRHPSRHGSRRDRGMWPSLDSRCDHHLGWLP